MPEEKILLPKVPEHPLLDVPSEEKLRQEIESLRAQLEQERNRNRSRNEENKGPKRPRPRTLWMIAVALVAILLIAFFVGFLPHYRREKQLQKDAEAEAKALPVLSYIYAERSPPGTELVLPGSVEAFTESPVLARADGYLKKRFADIGDRVKAGQLLAEISAPDLDQQVEQARAQLLQGRASLRQSHASLDQARANQALSNVTANRWAALLKRGAVAPQDNDARQADYRAQTANVAALEEAVGAAEQNVGATQANLNRLLDLQNYEQVRAPFSGVVTLRNIDEGALISTGQTLLFRVAKTDRLRTYVNVPESNAPLVQVGNNAVLSVTEYPGRQFQGEITRTSNSLDPTTRTLLTEVQIPNTGGTLLPGMFSEVTLKQSRPNPPVLIPADALIVRPNGTFVAVLKGDAPREAEGRTTRKSDTKGGNDQQKAGKGKKKTKDAEKEKAELRQEQQQLPTFTVHLEPVTVGRDYGNAVEILTGLNGGERVIENPNDHVQENAQVKGEKAKANPVTTPQSQPGKQNSNSENLSPRPNAEPAPKQPSKERMNRGPGF
jgi:RND family efflux transporter MFP subunit